MRVGASRAGGTQSLGKQIKSLWRSRAHRDGVGDLLSDGLTASADRDLRAGSSEALAHDLKIHARCSQRCPWAAAFSAGGLLAVLTEPRTPVPPVTTATLPVRSNIARPAGSGAPVFCTMVGESQHASTCQDCGVVPAALGVASAAEAPRSCRRVRRRGHPPLAGISVRGGWQRGAARGSGLRRAEGEREMRACEAAPASWRRGRASW